MNLAMQEHGFVFEAPYGELPISGDEGHGFRPFQLMTASIAGCSSGMLRKVLGKMRLDFIDIHVSTKVERSQDQWERIEKLHLHFVIRAEPLPDDRLEHALFLTHKNCSMIQTVKDCIEITESFERVAP